MRIKFLNKRGINPPKEENEVEVSPNEGDIYNEYNGCFFRIWNIDEYYDSVIKFLKEEAKISELNRCIRLGYSATYIGIYKGKFAIFTPDIMMQLKEQGKLRFVCDKYNYDLDNNNFTCYFYMGDLFIGNDKTYPGVKTINNFCFSIDIKGPESPQVEDTTKGGYEIIDYVSPYKRWNNHFILIRNESELHKANKWWKDNGFIYKGMCSIEYPLYVGIIDDKLEYVNDNRLNSLNNVKLIVLDSSDEIKETHNSFTKEDLKDAGINTNPSVVGYIAGHNNISCYTPIKEDLKGVCNCKCNKSESPIVKWNNYYVKVSNEKEFFDAYNWWKEQGVVESEYNYGQLSLSIFPLYMGVLKHHFTFLCENEFNYLYDRHLIAQIKDTKTDKIIYSSINEGDSKNIYKNYMTDISGFRNETNISGFRNETNISGSRNEYIHVDFYSMNVNDKLNYLYKLITNK